MNANPLPKSATRALRRTFWVLAVERGARAFWPLGAVLALGAALWLSGLVPALPGWSARATLAALGLGGLVALARGLRGFRAPTRAEARGRLDSTLPGRPLAALADSQAIGAGDPASRAVWATHRARMAERLAEARAPLPRPGLALADPFALRLIALTTLAAAALFGARTPPGELAALLPGHGAAALAEASWEGWIEPPGYTGKPVLYLADQPEGALAVPVGSRVTLHLYGKLGALTVEAPWEGAGGEAATRAFKIDGDGSLRLGGTEWQIVATPDLPPEVRPDGELSRNVAGEMRLPFRARDDYGVSAGQASMTLDLDRVDRRFGLALAPEPRAAVVVDLPMPYRGDRAEIAETLVENLAEHPWAGLPVLLTLGVTDAAGQQGQSAPMEIALPGRRFLDPLAAAIIEMRRDILWSAENAPRAARVLRAVSHRPEGLFPREIQYAKLRMAARQLERGVEAAGRDEVAAALWDIAVEIEDGALSDALERLRRAQERLSEAMRQGASPQELSELMEDYRQASRDYMRQLAEQGAEGEPRAEGEQMQLSQQDLQAMMDRIEELMAEGRTAEAEQMLQMLQQMMENMKMAQGGPGQQGEGAQAMEGLRDTLREQQGLSDEAFRGLQDRQGRGQQGQPGEGAQGQDGRALAERQRGLEGELEQQRQALPGAGTDEGQAAREALERAGRAMDDAARALEEGDTSGALDRQAEAMEALREGMRGLGEALRREAQAGQPGQQGAQGGQPGEQRQTDPLGRNPGGAGATATDSPLEGGEEVYRRAQELMDELRRRAGERDRPELERDYIRRLLDLF